MANIPSVVKVLMLKGDTGEEGFSPVVVVTVIPGGHKVTITDTHGNHSFEVLDGVSGNYSQLTNRPSINGVVLDGNKTSDDLGIGTDLLTASANNATETISANSIGSISFNFSEDIAVEDVVGVVGLMLQNGGNPYESLSIVGYDFFYQSVMHTLEFRLYVYNSSNSSVAVVAGANCSTVKITYKG